MQPVQKENLLAPGRQGIDGLANEVELLAPEKVFLRACCVDVIGEVRFGFRNEAGMTRLRTLAVNGAIERSPTEQGQWLACRRAARALHQLQAKVMHDIARERTSGELPTHMLDQVLIVSDQRAQQGLILRK